MTKPFGAGIRLLALDLDGTLVDSAPDLNHSLGVALAAVDLPRPSEAETRSWVGDGIDELVRRGLAHAAPAADSPVPLAVFRTAFAAFIASYAQHLFDRSTLYPRVAATLDVLLDRGIRLCCITNKRLEFAEEILDRAGIADRFELVLGGDSLPQKKPHHAQLDAASSRLGVPASAAALVGDSFHDFHAAKAAGWRFVWATYGYFSAIDLRSDGAIAQISEFAELTSLLGTP